MRRASTGQWSGGLAEWIEGDTAHLSVVFSWRLNDAFSRAVWYRQAGYRVRAGGPAILTSKGFLNDVAEVGGAFPDAIARHNPMATFASRGCDIGCWWCIVPKLEGRTYTEFPDFVVRPVLCDNNLSGLSLDYQRHIVGRYRASDVPLLDANSGFAAARFDEEVYALWRQVNRGPWRFAYDCLERRPHIERVLRLLRDVSPRRKRIYVMIGNEPVAACMQRIREVIGWGGEPHVQPFMKLNSHEKHPAVRFDWTRQGLRDVARWANRHLWKYTDFEDYRGAAKTSRDRRYLSADLFGMESAGE
jgi:hypothetical protein